MTSIAVIGAAGNIGSAIVREALERGHSVTALVRNPSAFEITHPNLTVQTADALDSASVARAAQGHDALVSAVGGGGGAQHLETIKPAAESLVAAMRKIGSGAPRLLTVGGAGSLTTADGSKVWDSPGIPEDLLKIMHAHGDALEYLRSVDDVQWTNLSPAALIAPGERTGSYRTAIDDLVVDENGESRISIADFAIAMVDEAERPQHPQRRFTVGY